jgi:hypothetical protein
MTDLLSTAKRPTASSPGGDGPGRPLAVTAVLAGAIASGAVLIACLALGLAGWLASDAGGQGSTHGALRVGADAWLLAHGAHLDLAPAGGTVTITAMPLGITALCLYVAFRLGRWAALTSTVDDLRSVALGTLVMAGIYGVVTVLTAVLASTEQAQPHLGRAFLGGFVVAFCGGGLGLAAGTGLLRAAWERLPETLVASVSGAVATVLLMVTAAALVLAGSLLGHLGAAANVLAELHVDTAGGLMYTVVVAAVTPNAVLLTGAYLLGPGFAVGTGTLVSPAAVVLGPVPAFPLLAALPPGGNVPWWTPFLVAVPVLLGLLAAVLTTRRYPVPSYELGALRGLLAGAGGGLVAGLLAVLAGGSVGPGRMAEMGEVGTLVTDTLVSAAVAMGVGGLIGGVLATWWARRRAAR